MPLLRLSLLLVAAMSFTILAESRHERTAKALSTQLDTVDDKEHSLTEWLSLFAKLTNENFILDRSLPASVGETKLTLKVQKGGSVLDAMAAALSMSGLRYAMLDGGVFISTEGKLMDRMLTGRDSAAPVGVTNARNPMSTGEAVTLAQPFDPYQDGFIQAREFINNAPWRHWQAPYYNPKTGITDFPGPPEFIEDPDIGHPRFRYTSVPFFLKPEYLALEQEKREYRQEQDRQERSERQANARAVSALLKLLKDNPDMKAEEILKKLGEK